MVDAFLLWGGSPAAPSGSVQMPGKVGNGVAALIELVQFPVQRWIGFEWGRANGCPSRRRNRRFHCAYESLYVMSVVAWAKGSPVVLAAAGKQDHPVDTLPMPDSIGQEIAPLPERPQFLSKQVGRVSRADGWCRHYFARR